MPRLRVGRDAIGEGVHHAGAATGFPHEPFERIVLAQAAPVLRGKLKILERFVDVGGDSLGRFGQLHLAQLGDDQRGLGHGKLGNIIELTGWYSVLGHGWRIDINTPRDAFAKKQKLRSLRPPSFNPAPLCH